MDDAKRSNAMSMYMEGVGVSRDIIREKTQALGEKEKAEYSAAVSNLFKPSINKAFYIHEVKLDYLASLLTYLKYYLPMQMAARDNKIVIEAASRMMGDYTKQNFTEKQTRSITNQIMKHIEKFKVENMEKLEKIKQTALYVNLENGNLISPIVSITDSEELNWLAEFLQFVLTAEINISKLL